MGVFPLGMLQGPVATATLDYYLARAQDYIGSPMLSAFYGVWAARRGDRKRALKLLDEGYGQFVTGRFLQTLEYRPDKFPEQPQAGPFFANMGGFLMSLLFGFTGLQIGPGEVESWSRDVAVLPQGWSAIEVDRVWIKGRPAALRAQSGKKSEVTFLD
jgi:hypothetical protein